MLSKADRRQQQAEAEALAAWWVGTQDEPFVLPRHEAYCVCPILFPSLVSKVRLALRSAAMAVIGWLPSSMLKAFFYRLVGVRIGREVYISPGVVIDPFYPWLIELEDRVFLGFRCSLLTHEYTASNFRIGRVRIGRGTVVGAYSIVRSGVSIGSRVTTGLGSVVVRDVADGETVVGVPARRIRPSGEGTTRPGLS